MVTEVTWLDIEVLGSGTCFGDFSNFDGATVVFKDLAMNFGISAVNTESILLMFIHEESHHWCCGLQCMTESCHLRFGGAEGNFCLELHQRPDNGTSCECDKAFMSGTSHDVLVKMRDVCIPIAQEVGIHNKFKSCLVGTDDDALVPFCSLQTAG